MAAVTVAASATPLGMAAKALCAMALAWVNKPFSEASEVRRKAAKPSEASTHCKRGAWASKGLATDQGKAGMPTMATRASGARLANKCCAVCSPKRGAMISSPIKPTSRIQG